MTTVALHHSGNRECQRNSLTDRTIVICSQRYVNFVLTRIQIFKRPGPRGAVLDRTVIKPVLNVRLMQLRITSGRSRDQFYSIRLHLNNGAVVLCVIFLVNKPGLQEGPYSALASQRRPIGQILRG